MQYEVLLRRSGAPVLAVQKSGSRICGAAKECRTASGKPNQRSNSESARRPLLRQIDLAVQKFHEADALGGQQLVRAQLVARAQDGI